MRDLNFDPVIAMLRERIPGLAGIWLFGSAANGMERPDSDLDLGVVATEGHIPRPLLLETRLALEALLNRDVDLVDLAKAPASLAREACWLGRRLAAFDTLYADSFEIRAAREYEDLKLRRAGIEADIRERGKVFP